MWSCPRERGRGALVMQCFFPVWDPCWSNLTFGWWASWEAPNVPHFLTKSESRVASHSATNNLFFSLGHTTKCQEATIKKHVCIFVSVGSALSQTVTFSQCAGNENVSLAASLFPLQRNRVQDGVGPNYNPNSLLWPFSSLMDWETLFLRKRSFLNNMPLGGKSWDRAMVGLWLNPELQTWIIHSLSQSFGTALETRASRSEVETEDGTINADVKQVLWSTSTPEKAASLKAYW